MTAHALIIEPEESARDAAAELLEEKGFSVTEIAGGPKEIDAVISDSTACVFIEAKTFEKHHELLDSLRELDVYVVGHDTRLEHVLSSVALASAVREGVQYAPDFNEAIDKAVETMRVTWNRARLWQGSMAVVADEMAFATPAGPIQPLKQLHDPETGRIDAQRVADYLGV